MIAFVSEAAEAAPGLSSVHYSPQAFKSAPPSLGWRKTETECRQQFAEDPERYEADYWGRMKGPRFGRREMPDRNARLSWAEGGRWTEYRNPATGMQGPRRPRGSSDIVAFSRKSRSRLLKLMERIDCRTFTPQQVWFVTLTYPGVWPGDAKTWKKHLGAFRKRLFRRWGNMAAVWKIEPQKRGAPHFHILLFTNADLQADRMRLAGRMMHQGRRRSQWAGGKIQEFYEWTARAWFEVVGSGDLRHLQAGTSVEPLDDYRQVVRYAGKYLGKEAQFLNPVPNPETGELEPVRVGKYWDVWHPEMLPMCLRGADIPRAAWVKIRRAVRRLHPEIPHHVAFWQPRSTTVFAADIKTPGTAEDVAWVGVGKDRRQIRFAGLAKGLERLLDEYAPMWRVPGFYRRIDQWKQREEVAWLDPAQLRSEFLDEAYHAWREHERRIDDGDDDGPDPDGHYTD